MAVKHYGLPSDEKKLMLKLGQVADFEIRLLKVFKAVVECGGFSAAETELNVGRSTISIHISNLEERLNLKLCRRGRGGFSLTEEGVVVYELMKTLFSSLEEFRAGINALHVQLSGELRIIASDTVCLDDQSGIPEAIAQFASQAPDVKVVLDVKTMGDIERMILNEEADIGFIPYHREFEGLEYTPLFNDVCHLYCSSANPLFAETDQQQLLAGVQSSKVVHAGVQTSKQVGEQLVGMNKAAISYFYEARLAMVLSGVYIGFLPDKYAQSLVAAGRLKMLLPQSKFYSLGVAAITRRHSKINRPRELFVDILRQLHATAMD